MNQDTVGQLVFVNQQIALWTNIKILLEGAYVAVVQQRDKIETELTTEREKTMTLEIEKNALAQENIVLKAENLTLKPIEVPMDVPIDVPVEEIIVP